MMAQLLAHLWGDYLLQSHWMAENKRTSSTACGIHVLLYALCFLPVIAMGHPTLASAHRQLWAILISHFLIDRNGVARYLVWLKNWMAPPRVLVACENYVHWSRHLHSDPEKRMWTGYRPTHPWRFSSKTGYPPNTPEWLATILLIVADNTLHLTCNYAALRWL